MWMAVGPDGEHVYYREYWPSKAYDKPGGAMIYLTHVRLGSILGQKVKMIRHGSVSGDFTAGMRPADEPFW